MSIEGIPGISFRDLCPAITPHLQKDHNAILSSRDVHCIFIKIHIVRYVLLFSA